MNVFTILILVILHGGTCPIYNLNICNLFHVSYTSVGFPGQLSSKEFAYEAGLILGWGGFPGGGNGNPFQYSCLGNPMVRGDWQATIYGIVKSHT